MRVLHVFHELLYSGGEIMYVGAAKIFQSKGCDLSVIATFDNLGNFATQFEDAGFHVYHRPYPKRRFLLQRLIYIIKFSIFLKNKNIDVVHIHANRTMFGIALSSWLANKRSVYTFHNVFPTHVYTRPFHIAIRWIAKNLWNCQFQTISESVTKNELVRFKNKTIKINNWYNTEKFFPARGSEKIVSRKELGIDENAFVIISIGGCSEIKRHEHIIQALSLVVKVIPNCIYLHLGSGETLESEKKLVQNLGLENNVVFTGNQDNVRKFLISSDLYVMTSQHEGMPITTIETMACEIPTILYNVPGLKDFNNTIQTTLLIEENFEVLSEQIIRFYQDNTALLRNANTARKYVEAKYDMKTNASKIYNLYVKKL